MRTGCGVARGTAGRPSSTKPLLPCKRERAICGLDEDSSGERGKKYMSENTLNNQRWGVGSMPRNKKE